MSIHVPRMRFDATTRLLLEPLPPDAEPVAPPERPAPSIELCVRTNYSFLQGGSPPEFLVRIARKLGYDAVGICDKDGLYGIVRAHEEAHRQGIRLVVGCELTLDDADVPLFVHVATATGYRHLCEILTESHRRHPKGKRAKRRDDRAKNDFAGVLVDFVCARSEGLWAAIEPSGPVEKIRAAFGDRASLLCFRHHDGGDAERLARALERSRETGVPVLATNAVRYAIRQHKRLLDVLTCIREGVTLETAGRLLGPNTEACLKSPAEMADLFRDHPEMLARSRTIADACRFRMDELRYQFPCELDGDEKPDERLRRLTYIGAHERYGEVIPEKVLAQIEKELALIAKLAVATYFLSVRGIIDIAQRKDILCQGRGSAANSTVCYCLGITPVDPAEQATLFERFLSEERREPPDIDVDFEHERREEVIQEIYETYGRDRAAMVSEIICYRGKSSLREVGKAFGLSLEQVERLSSLISYWDHADGVVRERLRDAGLDPNDPRLSTALVYAKLIQGFPRHLSIHVGGFVISAAPLAEVAPVEPATMPDRTVIPWDKDDIDTLGFFKLDVLGLGMLTAVRKVLEFCTDDPRISGATMLERFRKIPGEDAAVYADLARADTVGVFQIESRAQMAMLPRLKPKKFYDLVIEVAIVRPGPIQGGMVHPYLRRRNGEEPSDPPHPILHEILDRTLGVPLFQEQVMQIAIVGAGYSGGQADELRRDMAAWRRNGKLERHKPGLLRGFVEHGIAEEFGERLYEQMKGFGDYGFPESHAASFAKIVYASAWLKHHHPAAFAAALVNAQPMGFYSPSTILQDAARHGVEIRPIRVDASDHDCTLEPSLGPHPAVRVGLRQVKGLGEPKAKAIAAARRAAPFGGVEDLATRAGLERADLEALAEAGALDPFGLDRREALWKIRLPRSEGLFGGVDLAEEITRLPKLDRAAQLVLDYARTGLSVSDHPMRHVWPHLPPTVHNSRTLGTVENGRWASVAGLVICRQRPGTASGVVFVTMEDEHGFSNLVLWARVYEQYRHVATTSSVLLAHGKVETNGGVVYLVAERVERVGKNRLPSVSRDFH